MAGGRAGSPTPVGTLSLWMKCTSTNGASFMRRIGYSVKLPSRMRPCSMFTIRFIMVDTPSTAAPSHWFSAPLMLTIGPMSPATVSLCTVILLVAASTLTSATSAKWPAWLKWKPNPKPRPFGSGLPQPDLSRTSLTTSAARPVFMAAMVCGGRWRGSPRISRKNSIWSRPAATASSLMNDCTAKATPLERGARQAPQGVIRGSMVWVVSQLASSSSGNSVSGKLPPVTGFLPSVVKVMKWLLHPTSLPFASSAPRRLWNPPVR